MPSGARMSKRLSQAPRLSIVMAGEEGTDRKHDSVRDFFANHTKTIVTLVMIFGTILCIVLIVMVHKWRYDSNKAEEIQACLDVAVVGAGLSGSYATWRMRHDTSSKIHLFELSDRVGGRLYTYPIPEYPHLRAELGALYYLPQRHPLLNRSIHALNLTPSECYRQSRDRPTYYSRDKHRTIRDIKGHGARKSSSYNLHYWERDKTPLELKRYYTEQFLDSAIHTDPLSVTYRDDVKLYDIGYRSFLNDVASREGFNFLFDGVPLRSHVSNGNAALLASLDLDTWDARYTLEEGMDALPKAMVKQFENSGAKHEVHFNKRLACVHKENGYFTLIFQNMVTTGGVTSATSETLKVCTKQLILAVSPSVLKAIKFTAFEDPEGEPLQTDTPSALTKQYLEPVPAMTAYFLFNSSWWSGPSPQYDDIITDLPARRMRYMGTGAHQNHETRGRDEPGHLFLVASPDGEDVSYFDQFLSAKKRNASVECEVTARSMANLKHQIAKLQGLTESGSIPDPVQTISQDWREESFGAGWHMWKVGVNWDKASERMRQPYENEAIYVVGSDVCPGPCQFWAEGALQTVEELFQTFNTSKVFRKAFIAPLEDTKTRAHSIKRHDVGPGL